MTPEHLPVMAEAVTEAIHARPGAHLVDATLGLGGHAERLLEAVDPGGRVIGLDRDGEMLRRAEERLARFGPAFQGVRARFSYLKDVLRGLGEETVDGVLMDLGVCSAQLDSPERGLSFKREAQSSPLDMRLDRGHGETAAELIDRVNEPELCDILRAGGVPAPRRVARGILEARPISTAGELVDALRGVKLPHRRHHPATLVFQALRMAVNSELEELDLGLNAALEVLASGGRLVVLSYHSGEDRRVKRFLDAEVRGCICPPDMPRCGCGRQPRVKLIGRGDPASPEEVRHNPRSRSARLRAGERL